MERKICELYLSGLNTNQLASQFSCSSFKILTILKKFNIPRRSGSQIRRKYLLKEDYFDSIDSANKAYILGFIYADGCVFNSKKGNGCSIFIDLKDREVVDFIRSEITEKPLSLTKKKLIGLSLYSSKIAESLIEKGAFKCKSIILDFPTPEQVPEIYMVDFIRGVFDGDGSVTFSCKKFMARFSTSKNFATKLQEYLKNLNIKSNLFDSRKNCYYLSIQSKDSFIKFFQFLYPNENFKLTRKYNKFLEILSTFKN